MFERAKRITPPGGARAIDVLVLDAVQRQSLVEVRSLGQAGLRVGVADWRRAPAFDSRWSVVNARLPDVREDEEAYACAVGELVETHRPRVVVVAADATIDVLGARRETIAAKIGIAD